MAARVVAETIVGFILTVTLTIAVIGLLDLLSGTDAATSFLQLAPSTVAGTLWPALALWAALVTIGNIRNRHRASVWKFLTNLVSAIAAGIVNVVAFTVIAFSGEGGWALLLVGIVLAAVIGFVVAAALGLALTHFVFFRHPGPPAQVAVAVA